MKSARAARTALFWCMLVPALAAGLFVGRPSQACTLWGAAGERVAGGGTLVAKNRDWTPDHRQELSIVRPKEGYASVVLTAIGGAEPGTKAGVNEKGLVIVAATASQVPAADRRRAEQKKSRITHLLARCASVEEVLRQIDVLDRPVFYLLGDAKMPRRSPSSKWHPTAAAPSRARTRARCTTRTTTSPSIRRGSHAGRA